MARRIFLSLQFFVCSLPEHVQPFTIFFSLFFCASIFSLLQITPRSPITNWTAITWMFEQNERSKRKQGNEMMAKLEERECGRKKNMGRLTICGVDVKVKINWANKALFIRKRCTWWKIYGKWWLIGSSWTNFSRSEIYLVKVDVNWFDFFQVLKSFREKSLFLSTSACSKKKLIQPRSHESSSIMIRMSKAIENWWKSKKNE